ncbi:hypothetical protein F3Y22_tig00110858pilonHSYRG00045 [Hibiscus syriacus]|uniref:Protein kinase domain-containing protein n=1 Tax=Hibiscus syriacus TaxID=106335 RepID=A0A6A2ZJP7_HIBSY|nr:hypothetical protein F3Y22_tig00110858pilonHSYRG00045 [Hibiscus syriacus]
MVLRFVSSFTFLLLLTTHAAVARNSSAIPTAISTAKPGCKGRCGSDIVPFPFGIGPDCYLNSWFEVTCNETSTPPTILLKRINMEVLSFLDYSNTYFEIELLVRSPARNKFIAAGCDTRALIAGIKPKIVGCDSDCINGETLFGTIPNKTCNGSTCCETVIPSSLDTFNVTFESESKGCKLAFVADQQWLNFNLTNPSDLQNMEFVPAWLDWSLPLIFELLNTSTREYSCNLVMNTSGDISTGLCYCRSGYEGNPYLRGGCKDIDECVDERHQMCADATCVNKPGSYSCERSKTWTIALGVGLGFGVLFLAIVGWVLYKFLKKRRKAKLKRKFFKRNGGLLLQQQVHSYEGSLEKIKIFTSKELDKATDNFNKNRVLGQGGQGTVFKGMLVDGRIVAVKKYKAMAAEKVDDFINEVVILSQINHRNVVKLLGCCLETEVPLLFYEFISNGTLFQYLHDQSEEFQLSWETRLRIAQEAAEALAYLHSSASIPIYHRDIKSTNILLDEKFKAKVSDFGTSRSISIDQTHLTTHVQGTFGYLDPEFFQSSQFTEKSDVYSFGVVLVELLTGEKPILQGMAEEGRSLATHFIESMEEKRVVEIVDGRIVKQAKSEEVMMVAKLAYRCLNLSGKKRPTMKEVAMRLEQILPLPNPKDSNVDHHHHNLKEMHYLNLDLPFPWDSASSSTDSKFFSNNTYSLQNEPLV